MIVPMKKITVIVSEKEKDAFLAALRRKGVVHIKSLSAPSSREITDLENRIVMVQKVLSILAGYKTKVKEAEVKDSVYEESQTHAFCQDIFSLFRQKEDLKREAGDLEEKINWFKPWGGFDPKEVNSLREKKTWVKLYKALFKEYKKVEGRNSIVRVSRDKFYVYFVYFARGPKDSLDFEEVRLPEKSLAELENRKQQVLQKIEEIDAYISSRTGMEKALRQHKELLKKKLDLLSVKFGMKAEGRFSYLQGFYPYTERGKVLDVCRSFSTGYLVDEPDNPDETPTLIKNPPWIRIIEPVFRFMNTLPGYSEFDISFVFLIFFSLFFAMLIGDGGYGLLFVILTFLARRKFRTAPSEPFVLMYVLGVVTLIWGAITGTWFGFEKIAQLPVFRSLVIGKINSFIDTNQDFMIYLCFIIGVVHLSIAHLMIALKNWSLKSISQFGWISILWGLFFLAGNLVISRPLPAVASWLFVLGFVLVGFFSNPRKNILKGFLLSLADLPLSVISSFSDVVSYLRLFAVGYASVIVAESFNNMALGLGFGNIAASLGSALILFFGHALNIVLGLMAVVVHGIRLNMLEFSGHLGMQWSGRPYQPFKE